LGIGRLPGPFGRGYFHGCVYNPGPIGRDQYWYGDFAHLSPGPLGRNDLAGRAAVQAAPNEDEEELKRLVKIYGGVSNKKGNRSYSYFKKGKKQYRVDEYVKDRDTFFGTSKEYAAYKTNASTELDADKGKLRKYIEPPPAVRKKHADWDKAQDVFYAWVRKAYENQLGSDVDIPKLIKSQMSEKLKAALKQVKLDYGKEFQAGGFNPRPMKLSGAYRLGTISEHAVGTAIDIEDATNAQIESAIWKAILAFTGKSLSHATAQSHWKTAPRQLYDAVKAINDEFVAKLAKTIKETTDSVTKAAAAPNATKEQKATGEAAKKDALAVAIAQNPQLKAIGAPFLKRWQNGFMSLPWELVKELHEEGFVWGATFGNPDLHHFEL
jgi:hypothetical protein